MLLRRIVEEKRARRAPRASRRRRRSSRHPVAEARQAIAQTLERLRQDVALRERTHAAIGRWLESR